MTGTTVTSEWQRPGWVVALEVPTGFGPRSLIATALYLGLPTRALILRTKLPFEASSCPTLVSSPDFFVQYYNVLTTMEEANIHPKKKRCPHSLIREGRNLIPYQAYTPHWLHQYLLNEWY